MFDISDISDISARNDILSLRNDINDFILTEKDG